jgi:enamine deaminase RidA (YjgF/YER057c/UK114 family)
MVRTMTMHTVINPPDLGAPKGYSHAVVSYGGKTVYLAGQTAQRRDGSLSGDNLVEQYDMAARNVMTALRAAGGEPQHLVAMQVFVTDVSEYRASRSKLRDVWLAHFGDHYPAMALLGVRELFDPDALVELMAVAVIP